jgi:hypothetical protein
MKPGERLAQPFNVQGFRSQFLKPIFHKDLLYLPIALKKLYQSQKITFSGWNVSSGEFKNLYRKEYYVNPERQTLVDYCLNVKVDRLLVVEHDPPDSVRREGKISLFSMNGKDPLWESGPENSGNFPQILGIDETYVSVFWSPGNHLDVHSLIDGSLRLKLDVQKHFYSIREVQIKSNRIAVLGVPRRPETLNRDVTKISRTDVIVFDLKTGNKILSCTDDLKIRVGLLFFLERERIFIWSDSKPHHFFSVKFWD